MGSSDRAELRIKTLGMFEVCVGGIPIPEGAWPRHKTNALLRVLLTEPGSAFTVDQLTEALWPEASPGSGSANVRARVSELRRVLEPERKRGTRSAYIKRIGDGYTFVADPSVQLDTIQFEQGIASAENLADDGSWENAIHKYEKALELYRGEFLSEDRYADWAEAPRNRIRETHLGAIGRLAACYAQIGRFRQAISCSRRVLSIQPYRESAIRQLMEYQDAYGQRAQALETFQEGVRSLQDYLGVEPAEETTKLRDRIVSGASPPVDELDPRRIAVLPFMNYGPDAQDEYLASGMTEQLIGSLARIKDLRVVARTSIQRYKHSDKPAGQIGRELRAGTLLEGSVRRISTELRVTVQLIDSRSEDHLWAEDYDGSPDAIISVQTDVAQSVASALRLRVLADESRGLMAPMQPKPEAQALYLEGRNAFGKRGPGNLSLARELFEEALGIEPGHVGARIGLADCLLHSGGGRPLVSRERAENTLADVLKEHPDSPDAHATKGFLHLVHQGAYDIAERSLQHAIRLNPSHAQAHDWYAMLLMWTGRFSEAMNEARTAMDLAPLTSQFAVTTARTYLASNRFEEASALLDDVLQVSPDNSRVPWWYALACQFRYEWDEAAGWIDRYSEVQAGNVYFENLLRCWLNLGLGNLDQSQHAAERIVEGQQMPLEPRASLMSAAVLYHAGEYRSSVELLEKSQAAHSTQFGPAVQAGFHLGLGLALQQLGDPDAAIGHLEVTRKLLLWRRPLPINWDDIYGAQVAQVDAAIGISHVSAGNEEAARTALIELMKRSADRHTSAAIAALSFALGEVDRGFEWLSQAVDNHDRQLLAIKTSPWFDLVRDDKRFKRILTRMNLSG